MAWYDDVLAGLRQADNLDDSQRLEAARRIQQGYPEDTAVRIGSGQLPMDEASRMQRAREQGFDVDTIKYHGSPNKTAILKDGFDPDRFGQGVDQMGSGIYTTTSKSQAEGYLGDNGENAGILELFAKQQNPIEAPYGAYEYNLTKEEASQLLRNAPDIKDKDNTPLWDWIDLSNEDQITDEIIENVADNYAGYSHIMAQNDFYPDNAHKFLQEFQKVTGKDSVSAKFGNRQVDVLFDPSQAKLPKAAFDPEYKGGNLLGLNSNKKPNLISTNPLKAINPEAQSGAYMDAPEDNWVNRIHKATKGFSEVLPLSESGQRDVADFLNTAIEFTPIQSAAELADLGNSVVRGDENPNYMAALGLLDFIPAIGSGGKVANNIFAGSEAAARLGKLEDMKKAESMLDQGVDERKVWSDTGFFRGNDGLMRFEIDDSAAKFNMDNDVLDEAGEDGNYLGVKVNQTIDHPDLYNAYSGFENYRHRIDDEMTAAGEAQHNFGIITKDPSLMNDYEQTAVHELNHLVQAREGFSNGSDPFQIARELQQDSNDALDIVRNINAHMSQALERGDNAAYESLMKERTRALKDVADEYEIINRANAKYKRNLGEAESRLVEKRLNYNPEQRRAIFPYDDLDVPRNELWIGEKGKGNQGIMSIIESINNISNISSNLTDQQKLDRLGKDKAVSYVNGFLANEIPHLKQTIEKLKSGKKTEDYKSRIAEEESWLNRYEKARDYLTRKFPEDFKQEVQKNSKGVEDKFTAEVDSEIESYINDSINEVKENIAYGDISTSEAVNDALNAIEYGLSHKDNSNYFGNSIKESYVKKAVRKRISDALGLKAKE
jgi:hypothetical protein